MSGWSSTRDLGLKQRTERARARLCSEAAESVSNVYVELGYGAHAPSRVDGHSASADTDIRRYEMFRAEPGPFAVVREQLQVHLRRGLQLMSEMSLCVL